MSSPHRILRPQMRKALVIALFVLMVPPARAEQEPQPRSGATHAVPLFGEVVRVYDAPDDPYAPGHRGIDVAAPASSPVRASAPGTVSFAGNVAGNVSVTIDHDASLQTTYSYLAEIAVKKGQKVSRGTVVGTVGAGHAGSGLPSHVHLSARRDEAYFDPLELYVGSRYDDLLRLVA
jgi:murein DD-endopeptidase MepM/ murein hydrolase activator NlpD